MRRTVLRVGLLAVVAVLLVGTWAAAAGAQVDGSTSDDGDSVVVITGRVVVPAGDVVDSVVVIDGDVVVDGHVRNGVLTLRGDVVVRGEVEDSVVAVSGRVIVQDGAVVGHDVRSSERPIVDPSAVVRGTVEKTNFAQIFRAVRVGLWIGWWVAVTVSMLVLGLVLLALVPRALETAAAAGRDAVGPAVGWGAFVAFALPAVAVILLVTLVGLPLGLIGLAAYGVLAALGYVTAMVFLGRLMVRPPTSVFLAFLAGWGILRLVAVVPFFGDLVSFLAAAYGAGMLVVAAWRARAATVPAVPAPPGAPTGVPAPPPPPAPAPEDAPSAPWTS